jgi:hypothetical protein
MSNLHTSMCVVGRRAAGPAGSDGLHLTVHVMV